MNKKFLFFKKEEDARKRFPTANLGQAFVGVEGWMWTTKTSAKKYKLPFVKDRGKR